MEPDFLGTSIEFAERELIKLERETDALREAREEAEAIRLIENGFLDDGTDFEESESETDEEDESGSSLNETSSSSFYGDADKLFMMPSPRPSPPPPLARTPITIPSSFSDLSLPSLDTPSSSSPSASSPTSSSSSRTMPSFEENPFSNMDKQPRTETFSDGSPPPLAIIKRKNCSKSLEIHSMDDFCEAIDCILNEVSSVIRSFPSIVRVVIIGASMFLFVLAQIQAPSESQDNHHRVGGGGGDSGIPTHHGSGMASPQMAEECACNLLKWDGYNLNDLGFEINVAWSLLNLRGKSTSTDSDETALVRRVKHRMKMTRIFYQPSDGPGSLPMTCKDSGNEMAMIDESLQIEAKADWPAARSASTCTRVCRRATKNQIQSSLIGLIFDRRHVAVI